MIREILSHGTIQERWTLLEIMLLETGEEYILTILILIVHTFLLGKCWASLKSLFGGVGNTVPNHILAVILNYGTICAMVEYVMVLEKA